MKWKMRYRFRMFQNNRHCEREAKAKLLFVFLKGQTNLRFALREAIQSKRQRFWIAASGYALLAMTLLLISFPVMAQDMGSLERRLELATKMHHFRSSRELVDNAIRQVANQNYAPGERDVFITAMRNILNYKALEKIAIDAMAETYSEKELDAMVAYYSQPEAQSASDKTEAYYAKVVPEITRIIDKAMMRVRTGAVGP